MKEPLTSKPLVRLQNPEQHDIAGWARRAAELDAEIERLRAAEVTRALRLASRLRIRSPRG